MTTIAVENTSVDMKSFATNFLSLLLIIAGYSINLPYKELILNAGLFAFSGAITNWLAIHMLFEKVPFLYGSGIIPNKFEEFKIGIKKLIIKQFFTEEYLGKINESKNALTSSIDFENVYQQLLEAILNSPLGSMVNMFGGKDALTPIKQPIINKLEEIVNDLSQKINLSLDLKDKIEEIVDKRLNELTPQMVKQIIQDMIRKHLGWLVVWGGVFGGLIGVVGTLIK